MELQNLSRPFHHVVVRSALSDTASERLGEALRVPSDWKGVSQPGLRYSEFCPMSDIGPEVNAMSQELAHVLQGPFGAGLVPNGSSTVFRMDSGEGIGFHDDGDLCVIRVAVVVSKTLCWNQSGGLILWDAESPAESVVYRPIMNRGVAFRTLPGNIHAVASPVDASVDYMVVEFSETNI